MFTICRQENATFSPHFHATCGPPFRASLYYTPQYLNSGAGGISGIFLHDRHADDPPKHLLGWWSNKKETRWMRH